MVLTSRVSSHANRALIQKGWVYSLQSQFPIGISGQSFKLGLARPSDDAATAFSLYGFAPTADADITDGSAFLTCAGDFRIHMPFALLTVAFLVFRITNSASPMGATFVGFVLLDFPNRFKSATTTAFNCMNRSASWDSLKPFTCSLSPPTRVRSPKAWRPFCTAGAIASGVATTPFGVGVSRIRFDSFVSWLVI